MPFLSLLLNPRALIALAVALVLAYTHTVAYRSGSGSVQAEWDADKSKQAIAALEASEQARAREQQIQNQVMEAINAAQKRTQQAKALATAATRSVHSLREQIADADRRLSTASIDAVRQYSATAGALLEDCTRAYRDMAGEAGGHASDSLMLQESWPE